MKKIVVIGANYFQNPLIEKAKELGYETHVFAWKSGDIGEQTADYFYPISIVEKEQILEECRRIMPEAVVSVGSDLAVLTVNHVARKLGLPCNPRETDLCATNKYLMRQAMKDAGLNTPRFIKSDINLTAEALDSMEFPLIVKPTDRSGSRGVCKVWNYEEAKNAVVNACSESFENCAIIEEVIEGEEYSCECISQNGIHHVLAYTKKYTTDAPDYIETAHLEPSDLTETQQKFIEAEIKKGLNALHITTGASHTEFRINKKGKVHIIEIGARMGGDCIGTHLVPLSTGYDFTKMVIDAAGGISIDLSCWKKQKTAYVRFIMDENDIRLLRKIQKSNPELLREVSEIEKVGSRKIVDSSTRFGFFVMQCEKPKDLFRVLNE